MILKLRYSSTNITKKLFEGARSKEPIMIKILKLI